MGKKKEEKPKPLPKEYPENFSKWDIAKDKMSSSSMFNGVNDAIANPFEQLSVLFNQSNILNIQTKNLTVKIPMIYGEDINSYELYLKQRVNENINIAEKWIEMLTGVIYLCVPEADKSLPRQTNLKNARDQNKLSPTCQEAISKILKIIQDLENMLDRINENILILGEYRNLIFDLYEWVHVIDRYMAEISALINNFLGYLSYWMTTNANRYE